MKNLVSLVVMVWLMAGCALHTPPNPNVPDPWLNTIEVLARNASYIGARWDLLEHPEHAAKYRAAAKGLKALLQDGTYDAAQFQETLASLPALTGDQGALVISGGLAVYGLAVGFVDLTTAPRLEAAIRGTIYGLEQATAPAKTVAAHALRVTPLPSPLVVPPRTK